MISVIAKKKIGKFLRFLILHDDPIESERLIGFLYGQVPSDIISVDSCEKKFIKLSGEQVTRFHDILELLLQEPDLEYLTKKDIHSHLWRLVCRIAVEQENLRKEISRIGSMVEDFVNEIDRPTRRFLVVFPVTLINVSGTGLSLKHSTLKKIDVSFFAPADKEKSLLPEAYLIEFTKEPVVIVEESGNNLALVSRRAHTKAEGLLDLLRVTLRKSRFLHPQSMQFELGRNSIVVDEVSRKPLWIGREAGVLPFALTFDTSDRSPKWMWNVFDSMDSLPERIERQVRLACSWISKSMTDEENEHKIVFLCTAIESLLCRRSDQRKGEAMAFRMLSLHYAVATPHMHPSELLSFYELRSLIIHGSDFPVVSDQVCSSLTFHVNEILDCYIKFAAQGAFGRSEDLLSTLDKSDCSVKARAWLEECQDRGATQILEVIFPK